MKTVAKTTLLAATAAMVAAASPAQARPGQRGHDGIDAGDVIAGALVIGGIAAIASASSNDRYDRGYADDDRYRGRGRGYDNGYDHGGYGYSNNGYNSRAAVDQCVRAASRDASRYGRARVTDVTSINRTRGGYEVRGRLVVEDRGYWGGRDSGWNRYGNRYDSYNDGYDKGRFTCRISGGRVDGLRISGLRNGW